MKTLNWTSNPITPKGSHAELTEFLNAQRRERTLANITRRAETLFESGYTLTPSVLTGLYFVTSPKSDEYTVTRDAILGKSCDCEAFKKYDTCKHLQAVDMKLAEDELADAEWERAEEVRTFFQSAREYDAY